MAIALVAAFSASSGCTRPLRLIARGESTELRDNDARSPRGRDRLLVIALDGVGRDVLYDMLRRGALPGLASLLGGTSGGRFPHAHFDDTLLATLPSSTIAAWATAFTGTTPAVHGVTGNEFFVREENRFVAPAAVSVSSTDDTLATYTDGLVNRVLAAPTVYQRMRRDDPHVQVWVAMSQVHAGADRLLMADRSLLVRGIGAFLSDAVESNGPRTMWEELDQAATENVREDLGRSAPDVLTIYLAGPDGYAHHARQGPERAVREYLREVLDPQFERLRARLVEIGEWNDRYVVVTADHGHTEVTHDDAHALGIDGDDEPPQVLRAAGYRLRPARLGVDRDGDGQVVFADQGALAFVYLADRSHCVRERMPCDWTLPPRYDEDVLVAAEAFHRANTRGEAAPAMRGTLDMILVRRPRPYREIDLPFEVYLGGGRTMPVSEYLARTPHPTYIATEARLRDLAVGPRGERAGDVLLLANNGNRERADERYYFASTLYHSWHGSPSRRDSELPLIVAHPNRDARAIGEVVRQVLGETPRQDRVSDLLLRLRRGS